jgi:hypothetical protein
MYSPKVIREKQSKAESRLGRKLVRHTIQEVEFYNKHFDSITEFDKYGEAVGFTRELLPDELEYIENERELCPIDFLYWATRYAWIIGAIGKRLIRFAPNIAQKCVLDICGGMQERRIAIILLFLKARQLGISTLAELLVQHRVQFTPFIKAVLGSSDPKRSKKLNRMMKVSWERQPWWLRPRITTFADSDFYEYGHEGFLDIAWGNKKTGICRGDTPDVAHLSELAEWEDVKEKIDRSLVRAMHEHPDTLFIGETTADGPGGWLNDTWDESVQGLADNTNYYFPIFFPWYLGKDLYPTSARLRRQPIPVGWKPPKRTEDHAIAAKENVRGDSLLKRYLGKDWVMPIEQMWFHHLEYQRHKRRNDLATWFREMPATPLEAFTSSHGGIIDAERVIELQEQVRSVKSVYAVTGPEISLPLKDSEVDKTKEKLFVTIHWSRQYPPLTYTLTPLLYTGSATYDFNNKLVIWEEPLEGEEYVFGIDTSHGKERDSSVISGQRKWTPARLYDEQVCTFASNQVSSAYLWPFGMVLGTLYATLMGSRPCESRFQPMFAPEIPLGEAVIDEMKRRGWWNFYKRTARDQMKVDLASANKLGWSTDRHSRHMLMDEFSKAILEGAFKVNSPVTLRELATLVWNATLHRLESMPGTHDDHFFAPAIGYMTSRQYEQHGSRTSLYAQREVQKQDEGKYPEFDAGDFGRVTVSTDIRRRL